MSKIIKKQNLKEVEPFFEEDTFYHRPNPNVKKIEEETIQNAEKKAIQIIEEAESKGLEILNHYKEQGFQQGLQEGTKKGKEEVTPLADLFQKVIDETTSFKEQMVAGFEPVVLELAIQISKKIIRSEIDSNPEVIQNVLRSALEKIVDKSDIEIVLHPEDFQTVEKHQPQIMNRFAEIDSLKLTSDERISRGGCLIKTLRGEIDATVEQQFSELMKLFGREDSL